jgi:uncharacterized surface protein with fasciclin (FAS1) repeats
MVRVYKYLRIKGENMAKGITLALGLLSLAAVLPNTSMAQTLNKPMTAKTGESKAGKINVGSYSKLKGILQSAGFGSALGGGAYTIFAPTDNAFAKLSQSRLSDLLRPENRSQLKMIMAHHVVSGNIDLKRALDEGNGSATLRTLAGDSLTFRQSGNRVVVSDARGNVSNVTASNTHQGGSIVHAVDRILM